MCVCVCVCMCVCVYTHTLDIYIYIYVHTQSGFNSLEGLSTCVEKPHLKRALNRGFNTLEARALKPHSKLFVCIHAQTPTYTPIAAPPLSLSLISLLAFPPPLSLACKPPLSLPYLVFYRFALHAEKPS